MNDNNILAVVLAGGKSKRFGEDKNMAKLGNITLLEYVLKKVTQKFKKTLIISNQNLNIKKLNSVTIVPDCIQGNLGPLVGVVTAMKWIKKNNEKYQWVGTFPCDAPFFPEKLVKKLIDETKKNNFDIVIPRYKDQNHPVFGIWSLDLIDSLKKYLLDEDLKKIDTWIFRNKYKILNFKDLKYDPFFNINTVQELSKANSISLEFDI